MTGDAGRLQQVFANLLSNAVKFTPVGRSYRRRPPAYRGGLPRRRGVATPAAASPRTSCRSSSSPSARRRAPSDARTPGWGSAWRSSGTSSSSTAARSHVASEGPGKGATFSVRLPVGPATRATTLSRPIGRCEGGEGRSLQGLRLLLVEDDADTREVVGALLRDVGAEVMAVSTASRPRSRRSRAAPPDVLISDVGMADRDGYDLIRAVRAAARRPGG